MTRLPPGPIKILSEYPQVHAVGAGCSIWKEGNTISRIDRIVNINDPSISEYGLNLLGRDPQFFYQGMSGLIIRPNLSFQGVGKALLIHVSPQGTKNADLNRKPTW
jgi:hypothetical protein